MMEIILIEIISIVSYIYSLLMIFSYLAPIGETLIIFAWTIIISLIFALNYKKSKIYELSILLLLAPLIFYKDRMSLFFIIITTVIIYFYIKNSLLQGSHYSYSNKLKKTYLIYPLAAYLRLVLIETPGSILYALPFAIIYILTSIVLLRSTRHLESGLESNRIKKSNRIYLLSMVIIFAIGTIDGLRIYLKSIMDKIIKILGTIVYFPIQIITFLVQKFMDGLGNGMQEAIENVLTPMEGELIEPEILEELAVKVSKTNNEVFKVIGIIIFTILIIYIIYKLLAKTGNRQYEGLEYTEKRDHIEKDKRKKRSWFRERYPSELKEQIRYYYRRYLNKLDKEDVEILKSDTSLEVNEKAKEKFEEEIDEIRKIYIESRYGEKGVEKETVERMKTLFREL